MKEIPLTKGYIALVDDEDYGQVSSFNWYTWIDRRKDGTIRNVYAISNRGKGASRTTLKLHRFLMGVIDPKIDIDHKDHNGLNCCRTNLRVCTRSQNCQNRRVKHVRNTSGFKGVSWHRGQKSWYAQIMINGKQKALGDFQNIEDAAIAYNNAAKEIFGEFANLNPIPPERVL